MCAVKDKLELHEGINMRTTLLASMLVVLALTALPVRGADGKEDTVIRWLAR